MELFSFEPLEMNILPLPFTVTNPLACEVYSYVLVESKCVKSVSWHSYVVEHLLVSLILYLSSCG